MSVVYGMAGMLTYSLVRIRYGDGTIAFPPHAIDQAFLLFACLFIHDNRLDRRGIGFVAEESP